MQIKRKSEWPERKFELFIKTPCLNNNICENKYDWSQRNMFVDIKKIMGNGTTRDTLALSRTTRSPLSYQGYDTGN